jgi:hypothetical protein
MKTLLTLLLAICAATVYGQTIRTLGFNASNNQIVAATNLVWTNAFSFSTNTVAAQVRTNAGLGATWLTNTNVTNFRTAIGLGATNEVTFSSIIVSDLSIGGSGYSGFGTFLDMEERALRADSSNVFGFSAQTMEMFVPITFNNTTNAATTRTNLGLGGGITTNRSFVSYNGTNYTTNSVSISNGVITGWTQ